MKERACVYCGCTEDRACIVPVADLSPRDQRTAATFGALSVAGTIACWWISKDPPVCSAPACRAKYEQRRHAPDPEASIR